MRSKADSSFLTANPRQLFTERYGEYERFITLMRYSVGLRAYFSVSPLLRPDLRVLDAGCGTGAVMLALREALMRRKYQLRALHGFDLTLAMLDHLRDTLAQRGILDVELQQANVLGLDGLPRSWTDYDLIVSASMLEYVERNHFVDALKALRARLSPNGIIVVFMTRRNFCTRLLVGYWWKSNLYTRLELTESFQQAGFSRIDFGTFPSAARYMSVWGHIVEARR